MGLSSSDAGERPFAVELLLLPESQAGKAASLVRLSEAWSAGGVSVSDDR